ncbi:MAG: mannose-6-phosphate isomerase [Phycisphaerales bacterium]|jgi:mannose-6-phosphate isomerase
MPNAADYKSATPYPLVLSPILKPKVWGGRRLESRGKGLPQAEGGMTTFGESWELADLGSTSPGGGGGGAARSVIANGPLAGRSLHDAMRLWGKDLLGEAKLAADGGGGGDAGGFPLLVKYLDAREHLSVQNHPSPAYVAAHANEPGVNLKTESWVVLEADPGSVLYLGLKPGVTREDLERGLRGGTLPELLNAVSPIVGACYTLPSGCIHALGAGILVAEVQTPSDTTYRLYDWTKEYARPVRELHVEQALASCTLEQPPEPTVLSSPRGNLATTAFYSIDRLNFSDEDGSDEEGSDEEVRLPEGQACVVMLPRASGVGFKSRSGAFEEVAATAGQTVLIPAAISGDTVLRAGATTEALVVTIGS